MSSKELCCNGGTNGKDMALTERARSVLYTTCNLKLRVTCSRRTPLTQLSQFIECKLSDECELRIEHWSHMAWVEEETGKPRRLDWPARIFLVIAEMGNFLLPISYTVTTEGNYSSGPYMLVHYGAVAFYLLPCVPEGPGGRAGR